MLKCRYPDKSMILELHRTSVDTFGHPPLLTGLCLQWGPELWMGRVGATGDVAVLSSSCVSACFCCPAGVLCKAFFAVSLAEGGATSHDGCSRIAYVL